MFSLTIHLYTVYIDEDNSRLTPETQMANIGESVTFTCKSYGFTRWFVYVPYYSIHEEGVVPKVSLSNKYIINNISLQDGGQYYCFGSYERASKHFVAEATLDVHGKFHTS